MSKVAVYRTIVQFDEDVSRGLKNLEDISSEALLLFERDLLILGRTEFLVLNNCTIVIKHVIRVIIHIREDSYTK